MVREIVIKLQKIIEITKDVCKPKRATSLKSASNLKILIPIQKHARPY